MSCQMPLTPETLFMKTEMPWVAAPKTLRRTHLTTIFTDGRSWCRTRIILSLNSPPALSGPCSRTCLIFSVSPDRKALSIFYLTFIASLNGMKSKKRFPPTASSSPIPSTEAERLEKVRVIRDSIKAWLLDPPENMINFKASIEK